jgi:hypothetical protein
MEPIVITEREQVPLYRPHAAGSPVRAAGCSCGGLFAGTPIVDTDIACFGHGGTRHPGCNGSATGGRPASRRLGGASPTTEIRIE